MKNKELFHITILLTLTLLVFPAVSCSSGDTATAGGLNWQPDVYTAFETAEEEGKHVLLYLNADWCGYCRKLEAEIFTDPEVIDELGDAFVWVKLDGDKDPDGQRFKNKFNVRGYPAVFILDSDENELDRIAGYLPSDRFLELMKEMRDGETFAELKKQVKENPDDLEAKQKLAEKLLFRGQARDSIRNLEEVIRNDPGNEQGQLEPALYLMAQATYAMRQYEPTLDVLDKYEEKFPEGRHMADFMLLRAQMNLENNDTDLAVNTLEKFLEQYPDHPKADLVKRHLEESAGSM
mgnify:CR=1 FL=1